MTFLRNLWIEEQGQDLIEYTLLMAFVALASAALFLGAGGRNRVNPSPALEMHESEASFQAVVDPYARADFFVSFGEEGVRRQRETQSGGLVEDARGNPGGDRGRFRPCDGSHTSTS